MSDFLSGKLKEYSVRTGSYVDSHINNSRNKTIVTSSIDTNLLPGYETTHNGKVRDLYICNNYVVMVATDRQSAFDRALASIPYKGQVLNLTSMWWFKQTETLVPNHVLSCPHPNVTIGKRCTVFPVEFVMRGYITGTTSTSMWQNYNKGVRDYCGHKLQEGLKKNQKLDHIMLTPTTKSEIHDELISAEAIVSTGLMTQEDWNVCSDYAHKLFSFSQAKAMEMGLILVDTKYEFGKDKDGQICLIDEIQTPDSSRYWIADSYDQKMSVGEEPDNIDKEFLRKWFHEHCDPYNDELLPEAPPELVNELSRRYIMIYEILTGNKFNFAEYADAHETLSEIVVSSVKDL